MTHVRVGSVTFGNDLPFVLIAGPCQMQSARHAFDMAGKLREITDRLGVGFVFKASFDKANRTSLTAARGVGLDIAYGAFTDIRHALGVPVLTDVHEPDQCERIAGAVDVLQIPALLCRQTDLLVAAARTGLAVNIKKGQFMAPADMEHAAVKVIESGGRAMLTERGSSFGYGGLVADMRSLAIMAETRCPVIFDATHSVQSPGSRGSSSGGDRRFTPVLARAAVAVGVAGVFIETHEEPELAPSDGPIMTRLAELPGIVEKLLELDAVAKRRPWPDDDGA